MIADPRIEHTRDLVAAHLPADGEHFPRAWTTTEGVRVRVDSRWLTLQRTVSTAVDGRTVLPNEIVGCHDWMPAGIRFEMDRDALRNGTVTLRGERRLADLDEASMDSSICQLITDFNNTLERFPANMAATEDAEHDTAPGETTLALAAESSWQQAPADNRGVGFDLRVRRFPSRGVLTDRPGHGCRLCTELGFGAPDLPPPTQHAVALLALLTTNSVRLVRPTLRRGELALQNAGTAEADDGLVDIVGLEVITHASTTAADIDDALASLSIACSSVGPEIQLFCDFPDIARVWLRGWSPSGTSA